MNLTNEKQKSDKKVSFKILKNFIDLIPLFIPIAVLLSILAGISEKKAILITWIIAIVGAIIGFAILYKRASEAAKSPKEFPFPSWFWRFVTNKVPSELGQVYGKDKSIKILIICDNETKKMTDSIIEKYKHDSMILEKFEFRDIPNIKEILIDELNNSDAVYLFWTIFIKNSKSAYPIINNWALKNSDKAVLVVNMIPHERYYLTFNTIPKDEAISGIWLLFARSTERAQLWKSQANIYRKFLSGITLFLLSIILYLGIRSNGTLKKGEAFYLRETQMKATWNNLDDIVNFYENYFYKKNDINKADLLMFSGAVDGYVEDKLSYLLKNSPFTVEFPKLSFWRIIKEEGINKLYEFAVSGAKQNHVKKVDLNEGTIIGGAFLNPHNFILWKKDFNNGEPACWDIDNNIVGTFVIEKDGERYIRFKESVHVCHFRPEKELIDQGRKLKGLLCFAIKTDKKTQIGVSLCITGGQIEFLTSTYTKNYLLRMISDIILIPNEFIKPEK